MLFIDVVNYKGYLGLGLMNEWGWIIFGNVLGGENRNARGRTCPIATWSITNPIWTGPASNPGHSKCKDGNQTRGTFHGPLHGNGQQHPHIKFLTPYDSWSLHVIRHCINFCFERKRLNYSKTEPGQSTTWNYVTAIKCHSYLSFTHQNIVCRHTDWLHENCSN
jgi:hypothetical protein